MPQPPAFSIGDKVFAKVRGYPPWPAKVENVVFASSKQYQYHVLFYGAVQTGVCKETAVWSYTKNRDKLGKPSKRKLFNKALAEIELELLYESENEAEECIRQQEEKKELKRNEDRRKWEEEEIKIREERKRKRKEEERKRKEEERKRKEEERERKEEERKRKEEELQRHIQQQRSLQQQLQEGITQCQQANLLRQLPQAPQRKHQKPVQCSPQPPPKKRQLQQRPSLPEKPQFVLRQHVISDDDSDSDEGEPPEEEEEELLVLQPYADMEEDPLALPELDVKPSVSMQGAERLAGDPCPVQAVDPAWQHTTPCKLEPHEPSPPRLPLCKEEAVDIKDEFEVEDHSLSAAFPDGPDSWEHWLESAAEKPVRSASSRLSEEETSEDHCYAFRADGTPLSTCPLPEPTSSPTRIPAPAPVPVFFRSPADWPLPGRGPRSRGRGIGRSRGGGRGRGIGRGLMSRSRGTIAIPIPGPVSNGGIGWVRTRGRGCAYNRGQLRVRGGTKSVV